MDNRGQKIYEPLYRDKNMGLSSCPACISAENESRLRRRCRSEGLERSPFSESINHPRDWPENSYSNNYHHPDRAEHRKLPATPTKMHYVKFHSIREPYDQHHDSLIQYGVCKQNGDCLKIESRLSNYKVRSNGCQNAWFDSKVAYNDKACHNSLFIENEEPRLCTVSKYKDRIVDSSPRSSESAQQCKMPLKSILINNRRSVSPSCFRKSGIEKPAADWTEVNIRESIIEGKRRVRARSESEKTVCLASESCSLGSCCLATSVQKRHRGSSPPPTRQRHTTPTPPRETCLQRERTPGRTQEAEINVLRRDIGVGEWSIFDGVTLASSFSKSHPSKSPAWKSVVSKGGKQPSARAKSRLQAIKAKKALVETCSTGSELSDDELSDPEDAASKASLDGDSDVSVEPVDHQECLTSDSGPSVSSTSDSASLNGLTSALSVGATVSPDNENLLSMLRPSLFPSVPPYLRFVLHDAAPPQRPPPRLQRHLRWRLTPITPVVVRRTLLASGFKLVRSECATQGESMDWIGTWGKHMKSICFKTLKDSQKMNHFPGTFQIGRKDRLWRNLHKLMMKYGSKEFGLMPKTYVLPHDLKLLKYDWEKYAAQNEKWIIKPPASARGTGIKVVSRWAQIPKRRPVVVQRYIAKPYLINGSKFDMRLYVLVTSVHPLRIYLYPDGLARFASVKYSEENNSLHDRYMHLTNYSINRLSKTYAHNQDASACQGHKWTLRALLAYLKAERGVDTTRLWAAMRDLVVKTVLSGESSISCLTKANIGSRFNCYELFGIDVLLDEHLKPWLLEVNISPSLHSASPLDLHVKGPLVASLLNMAQFHMPAKVNMEGMAQEMGPLLHDKRLYTIHLSKEEKAKHTYFTELVSRMDYLSDILINLTPDDVRHLVQYEDELTQKASLEKIFPTPDTHTYLDYFAGPRYYNRLFDAWETKYANNRKAGIKRLQELCDQGVHLEVPPMPAKNDDSSISQGSRTHEASPQPVPEQPQIPAVPEPIPDPVPVLTPASSTDCSEAGHIVGEFCLDCRPTSIHHSMDVQQPLPVQQEA